MNANDIVSLIGIVVLGAIGIYFQFKSKQLEKKRKMSENK